MPSECYNWSMLVQSIFDLTLLFVLGLFGWFLLSKVRVPAAEIIGPVAFIGTLRAMQCDLPTSPDYLFQAAQVIIGIFVGSMLTRETLRELKPMAVSALIIITWALSIVFIIGYFLARYSALDLYTAMLSASMGGLPEITVIALASGATVAVVIIMQMIRMLGTVLLFPVMLRWLERGGIRSEKSNSKAVRAKTVDQNPDPGASGPASGISQLKANNLTERITALLNKNCFTRLWRVIKVSWLRVLITLTAASLGGILLEYLGVPAGLLVGSIIAVGIVSVAGIPVSRLSPRLLDLLLVFIGITVADNITIETIATMANAAFIIPIMIATLFMFATSFMVAWILHRLTGWDFPTSFLAAAPGGFTVMTALAVKHNRGPFKVSMLHLCRLLSINLVIPFVFIFLMSR